MDGDRMDSGTGENLISKELLRVDDSDDILDNAVSLSSAVVSDEEEVELTFSTDLLIIAPSSPSRHGSNPSTESRSAVGHSHPTSGSSRSRTTPTSYSKGENKSSSPGLAPEFIPPKRRRNSWGSSGSGDNKKIPARISVCSSDDGDGMKTPPFHGDYVSYFGFTKNQWVTLIIFAFANVFGTTVISIQAPFYPAEAEKRGATATEYGLVFGIFQLTMFIMSPIYGSYIGRINPKVMFNVGMFTTGTCAILFGLLDYVDDRVTFIALSFAIRILQACGDSAFVTASFTIIAMTFPSSVATTFAALETCSGLGLIIGPTAGGLLFEIGGFKLPFLTCGSLLFLMAVLTLLFLPNTGSNTAGSSDTADSIPKGFSFFSLIKTPAVALAAFSIAVSSSSIGFLGATLEPHLRDKFSLTPVYTGLIFIIDGALYALSAPLWGRLCDKSNQPKVITLVGCGLTFAGFLVIGPAPFMPFDTMLWLVCIGLAVHGLGVGASLVSGFIQAMQDAVDNGFPDNVGTYGLVSGLWISFFALGSFAGPSIGGILLDNFGFSQASLFVLVSQLVIALFVVMFLCIGRKPLRSRLYSSLSNAESDPLLTSTNISFNNDFAKEKAKGSLAKVNASYGAA